jgi:putative transcriptional regulator
MIFVELTPLVAFRKEYWTDEDPRAMQNVPLVARDAGDLIRGSAGFGNCSSRRKGGGGRGGARATVVAEPDVRAIRRAANISQSQFAKLIGVNLRTLQNWEQRRTRPTGPARALLKIVALNPKSALKALHA